MDVRSVRIDKFAPDRAVDFIFCKTLKSLLTDSLKSVNMYSKIGVKE